MPAHHPYPDPPPPSPSRESVSMRALTLSGGRGILSFELLDASSRRRPPPTTSRSGQSFTGDPTPPLCQPRRTGGPTLRGYGERLSRHPKRRQVTLLSLSARTRARRASARTGRTRAPRQQRGRTVRHALRWARPAQARPDQAKSLAHRGGSPPGPGSIPGAVIDLTAGVGPAVLLASDSFFAV